MRACLPALGDQTSGKQARQARSEYSAVFPRASRPHIRQANASSSVRPVLPPVRHAISSDVRQASASRSVGGILLSVVPTDTGSSAMRDRGIGSVGSILPPGRIS
jgi:hypothetical protein